MPDKDKSSKTAKKKSKFKRQKIMDKVLIALTPALIGAVYFFGWRSLAVVVWTCACCALIEYWFASKRGDPCTEAALVTGMLLGLSFPPTVPFWMAAVGSTVGILFGKEFFGGFGRNVFNPAIVGRAFMYTCFPIAMTGMFTPVWSGFPGGFAHWSPNSMIEGINAVTTSTPMYALREFGYETPLLDLLVGNIGGTFQKGAEQAAMAAGSMGEISAILVTLGGIYLLFTKTANWRLVLSTLLGATAAVIIFRHIFGIDGVPGIPRTMLTGAMLYAAFFMVTDPVSAPKDKTAQFWYGGLIGFLIVFMRWKAVFAGAVAFSILLGNTFGPTIELGIKEWRKSRKAKASAKASGGKTQEA